jgi:hypothetical protein
MRRIIKFLAGANFGLAVFALIATILEWKFTYISEDVFFRVAVIGFVCLILVITIKKIRILNKLASHVIMFLIIVLNIFFVCRDVFIVNGFVIAVPPNFKGQIYIKMNDKNSDFRLRPFNGVVVFPIDSKGQVFTKSIFDVSESTIFPMELVNGHLVSNENLKITEVVIHPRGLSDSSEVVITAHIY